MRSTFTFRYSALGQSEFGSESCILALFQYFTICVAFFDSRPPRCAAWQFARITNELSLLLQRQPLPIRATSASASPLKAELVVGCFRRGVRRRQRRHLSRAETVRVPPRRLQREGGVALRGEPAGQEQVQAGNHRARMPVSIRSAPLLYLRTFGSLRTTKMFQVDAVQVQELRGFLDEQL